MEKPDTDDGPQHSPASGLFIFLIALATMVGLIYYSYTYPYPSAKSWTMLGFAGFWLRELLILAFAVLTFLWISAAWLLRVVQAAARRDP